MDGGHQNFNLIFHTLKPDAYLQKEKRMTTIMSSSSFDEKLLLLREPFLRSLVHLLFDKDDAFEVCVAIDKVGGDE